MTFLSPAAFLLLLAIPVVVLFHLLKIRRQQVVVSSTLLWVDRPRELRASAPFRQLKPNLLLLLQILSILALALALARPVRIMTVTGYERNVLILDVAASMQARDIRGSRFSAAQQAALATVEQLRPGQEAMLIESGQEARVLVPFTEDKQALRQAIQAIQPLDVAGRLPEAFRLAQANLQRGGRTAVVHVFTDGAFETPTVPDLGGAAIRWHLFGQHGRNIGITAFEVRKTFFGAIDYQAFLSVVNYSNQQATFDLVLTLDGKRLKTERVTLGPEVKRSFVIPFAHGAGGILRAEISAGDDLAVDNQAMAVIPPPHPVRVLLISSGDAFLEKALTAAPQLKVEMGTPDLLSKGTQYDVVIIDNVPVKRVPPGRYLFIHTLPEGSSLQLQGRVEQPAVIDWDRAHPVMRYLDFSKVVIQEAMRVRPLGSGRVLVESNLTPLIYALDDRGMKAIFVGFDLFRTDFPLRVAFPLFVSNALRWLYPNQLEDAGLQLHTGQPLMASLPAGEQVATLIDPNGKSRSLQADANGRVSFADTTHVGIYTLKAGTWEQRFAVNLLDEGESNIAPRAKALPERAGQGTSEDQPSTFPSQQELWRFFAIAGLLLLLLEGLLYHRETQGHWPLAAAAARILVLLLLILGLTRVGIHRVTEQFNVLFLLDASDSIPLETRVKARQYVEEAVKAAGPRDRYGVVVFGGSPVLESPVGSSPLETKPPMLADSRATDIGAAIKLALAAFPQEGAKRIVLLSDGNENQGDAREAARRARTEGVDIYAVPLQSDREAEPLVESLVVPQEVKFGESFLVRIMAWSPRETTGKISLYRDGQFVGVEPVELTPGKNVFAYQQSVDQGGFHVFQARLETPDELVQENKRGVGVVAVRGRPRVLYVEKDRDQGANLLRALRAQNLQVEMVGPQTLPTTMEGLTQYDSIILSNISALNMTKGQMDLLRNYVRDQGGGLIMLGGEESFGVGGYYRTPVEEALPVTMEARQKVEIPSLAVALVIDRSGSMEESSRDSKFTKLDLAKEAAQLAVEVVDERTEVGVVAFDTAWDWVVPMGPAKNKDQILKQIATIKAGGGTDLFPPLKDAYEMIYDRNALLRHVIVLSDGEVQSADFQGLVRRMQQDKITVSAVAIGSDADVKFMTDLSRWGHGRFYYTDDISSIPRIFTRETQLASKASIIEQPFRPALVDPGHEISQDIHWDQAPPLGGYVSATPKPTADTILISNQRDPVLAAWRYGLGRSVAFTSDAKGKWGILWLKWDDFGKFFGQMVRWTLRTAQRNEVITSVVQHGGEGEIQLEAVNEKGEFVNFLEANAGVVSPDKREQVVPLQQMGPGRYGATFPATDDGAYLVGVTERSGRKMVDSQVTSLVAPYSPELRALGVNESLLHDVATLSGGAVPSRAADSFTQNRRKARIWVAAWPYLLGLALLLFLPDIAIRRWRFRGAPGRGVTGRRAGESSGTAGSVVPAVARFGGRGRRA